MRLRAASLLSFSLPSRKQSKDSPIEKTSGSNAEATLNEKVPLDLDSRDSGQTYHSSGGDVVARNREAQKVVRSVPGQCY